MKCTIFLLPLVASLVAARAPANSTNTPDALLKNGAALSVNIKAPQQDVSFPPLSAVTIQGMASLEQGNPSVAYIYIIDSSGSTYIKDYSCDSVLDCIQEFFLHLHQQTLKDGSAKLVGVIDFDDYANVTAQLQDPNNTEIEEAIRAGEPSGLTNCTGAIDVAAAMATEAFNHVDTVIVFFLGDGGCDVDTGRLQESIDTLAATNATVHSVAVGGGIDCDDGNDLQSIAKNGGRCTSVPEPYTLANFTRKSARNEPDQSGDASGRRKLF